MSADTYGKTNLQPGYREINGSFLNDLLTRILQGGLSRQDSITATPGGTKAAAYALKRSLNRVSVCATANNSVLLPKAIAGSIAMVVNSGAATLAVYGKGSDTIDGVSTATANTIATTKSKTYVCFTAGAWFTMAAVA